VVSVAISIATHNQPDIVRGQPEIHREHQELIHGVIEAQVAGRQPADLQLVADITALKNAGRETDESGQDDEHVV